MKRKIICLLLVLLVVISNMNFAFADSQQSTQDRALTILNSIDDTQKKDMIMDIFSLCYMSFTTAPPTNDVTAQEQDIIKELERLSQMSSAELEDFITREIAETIKIVKETPNTFFTDSAYKVLEKYNFTNDIEVLKKTNIMEIPIDKSVMAVIPDRDYTKTAYGTCNYPLFGVIGGMDVKVKWSVRNEVITTFSRSVTGYGSNYAEYGGHQLNSSGIYNAGQRANINVTGYFYLTLLPIVSSITADIWFYNDGGLDIL